MEFSERKQKGVKRKRTRNGCLTCRDRHLKCDENLPTCNNCIKSKRECFRGIRLKFLNTQVHKLSICCPVESTTSGPHFMDQSIVTASQYEGGDKNYSKYRHLHSKGDLKRAQDDFDKYLGVSLSTEEPPSKRPKIKKSQDLKFNSANFRQLLDDFLKFEEVDSDFTMTQDSIMTKFNYIDPPIRLEDYLEDVKVRNSKSRFSSLDTQSSNMSSVADYYIFDSDEERDNLTSPSTDYDELFMEPLSDKQEIELLTNYLKDCRWFLNKITDNRAHDYWMNSVLSERSFRDNSILRSFLKSYGLLDKEDLEEPLGHNVSEYEKLLRHVMETGVNKKIQDLMSDSDFGTYIILITLLISGYFQKALKDKAAGDALVSYIKMFNDAYIESVPKISNSAIPTDPLNLCIVLVAVMDLMYSVLSQTAPVLDPSHMEVFMINRTTEFEGKSAHEYTRQRIESTFEYEVDDYETDESDIDDDDDMESVNNQGDSEDQLSVSTASTKLKLNDVKYTDASYLVTVMNILGRVNHVVRHAGDVPLLETKSNWNSALEELVKFEQGLPFCYSPISVGPLKNQAAQGLAIIGVTNDFATADYAAEPPFPFIKFSNETGILIHIIHHVIYLLSDKFEQKGMSSFFKLSQEFLQFRAILWYNETIPHEDEGSDREKLHMARRVISYFLSCHRVQKHKSDNIWFFYGWCFEIAKEFLPEEDMKELEKRCS